MSALGLLLALAVQQPVVLDPGFSIAGHRIVDANADGRANLIVVAADGRVRTLQPYPEGGAAPQVLGELHLADALHTLLDLGTFGGRGYLVAQTAGGTLAYAIDERGSVASEPQTWIARAKLSVRVEQPTFTNFVRDVNQDGTNDIIVPTLSGLELWLGSQAAAAEAPRFRKAATVAVDISRGASNETHDLSDSLEASFAIPDLDTQDVNGDGRPDLLVSQEQRRAFHLQRADGSFPLEPDVQLDLSIFRDTTEAAPFQLGGTLSVGDRATYASRDLDGDGIPDFVIGHRRKVWVFRGTEDGPQFVQPSAILKTADDITALLVHQLDGDSRPDLLLVKVQVPTLATLLRGLFGEWDVRVRVLAYSNVGEGKFETSPSLTNDLALRLPGIVGLVKNPEKILERFDELGQRFRSSARGDVDGNGTQDVLLVTEDAKALEVWLGVRSDESEQDEDERKLREILFDDTVRVWDIERMLAALGDLAQRRVALLTGGRAPDRRLALRSPEQVEIVDLECADVDGDGAEEVVVSYHARGDPGSGWFEVLRARGEEERK